MHVKQHPVFTRLICPNTTQERLGSFNKPTSDLSEVSVWCFFHIGMHEQKRFKILPVLFLTSNVIFDSEFSKITTTEFVNRVKLKYPDPKHSYAMVDLFKDGS